MLVREIWKFIHHRVSYSLMATPEGDMILMGEYIIKKSYSTPSEASRVFPPELSFIDRKTSEALGTHHLQATLPKSVVVDVDFKCLRQRSNYHIPWWQRPRGIWYSWVNTLSFFLNLHFIKVLLYRMKPRKHIHVKYLITINILIWLDNG
jgi:hypothetical protein